MKNVSEKLVSRGMELFRGERKPIKFTGIDAADKLLNDLDTSPHAFVLACVTNRQVKAEVAWTIPYELSQRLGDFSFDFLRNVPLDRYRKVFSAPSPLHRFPDSMSEAVYAAVQRIADRYQGNAAGIWQGKPPSAQVVLNFLGFRGVGPKIATMAANILARDFKVPFADYCSIDVSVDVHLRRVFTRLGLIREDASVEEVVYQARAIHPEFPGLMDLPAWEIGREWCRPTEPICPNCYMVSACPTYQSRKRAV